VAYSVEIPDEMYWKEQIKCQSACPVHTDARGYVRAIAQGRYAEAYLIARAPNPLASICGRICAAPCEVNCRRGEIDKPVSIRALKRFASEQYAAHTDTSQVLKLLEDIRLNIESRENRDRDELTALAEHHPKNNTKIAIIGSGPAGLACGHDLALLGFSPTIFETEDVAGGMLAVGIPDYRLPRDVISAEIDIIKALGVEFRIGTTIGKDVQMSDLRADFDAVVIAVGAKRSRLVPVPGSDHPDVLGGVEFLRNVSLGQPVALGNWAVVIGGGSVAYDVGRSVLRHEPLDVSQMVRKTSGVREVHLCCLESLDEMPADIQEIIEGEEEGITRVNSVGPQEILIENDRIVGVRFKKCVSVFDDQGHFNPQFDESDLMDIPCDNVLMSVGQQVDFTFIAPSRDGVTLNDRGLIPVEPDGSTDHDWLFVAGDCAYGTRLVIDAVAHGKRVARTIAAALFGIDLDTELQLAHQELIGYAREASYEEIQRQSVGTVAPELRLGACRTAVELGYTEAEATTEAGRCLDCGVNTIFNGEVCVLCGGCADVCPELCLKLVTFDDLQSGEAVDRQSSGFGPGDSAIIKDETACIRCACCADRCPVGAITMERATFCEVGNNV
jgi:NADPH-dependent glutamate synthase beta subunit-like oxidoreductase